MDAIWLCGTNLLPLSQDLVPNMYVASLDAADVLDLLDCRQSMFFNSTACTLARLALPNPHYVAEVLWQTAPLLAS